MKNNITDDDKKFLAMTVDLALANVESGGGPFGAAIVRQGELVSTGVNRVTVDTDPTAHAEVLAIRKAAKVLGSHNLENCTLYASTEPCPMCLGAIYWAGINRLVFASGKAEAEKAGFIDAHIYREILLEKETRSLSTVQLDIPGAGKEFMAWAQKQDKNSY